MRRKIPSTGALIAFEAAARHQSFSRAAEELALTEGAISKQIAALEDYLGLRLFHRAKKRVTLSDVGKAYFAQVKEDLHRLERNTLGAMAYQDGQKVLELAVIPTFSAKWLIPRLAEFGAVHPDITINLSERALPFLFGDSVFDAAVHYKHPAWAGNVQELLFEEELVPVCSPKLIPKGKTLSAADLASFPLLHKNTREEAWPRWFQLAGDTELPLVKGPRYDLFSLIIQAACYAMGVALVPRLYVQDELKNGSLVIPVNLSIRGLKQYCVVYPEHKEVSGTARLFVDWLLDAAKRQRLPGAAREQVADAPAHSANVPLVATISKAPEPHLSGRTGSAYD